eukprot:tig00020556_g10974.t1
MILRESVWLAERYLTQLKERDANIKIIVFRRHAALYAGCLPAVRLARAVFLAHLRAVVSKTLEIFEFEDWESPEWIAFLDAEQPSLLIASDGSFDALPVAPASVYPPGPPVPAPGLDGEAEREPDAVREAFGKAYRCLVLRSLDHKLPVALSTGLEFRGGQALAFVAAFAPQRPGGPDAAALDALAKEVIASLRAPATTAADDALSKQLAALDLSEADPAALRLRLLAAGAAPLAGARPDLARVLLLHGALLGRLALEQRALRVPRPSAEAAAFLQDLCAALERAVAPCKSPAAAAAVADLVDGRLFHALAARLLVEGAAARWSAHAAGLSPADSSALAAAWSAAGGKGDFWAPLTARITPAPAATDGAEADGEDGYSSDEGEDDEEADEVGRLMPVECPIVDAFLQKAPLPVPPTAEAKGAMGDDPLDARQPFLEDHSWPADQPIIDEEGGVASSDDEETEKGVTKREWNRLLRERTQTRAHVLPKFEKRPTPKEMETVGQWRKKQKQREEQKFMRFMQRYAVSLEGSAVLPVNFTIARSGRAGASSARPGTPSGAKEEKEKKEEKKKGGKEKEEKEKKLSAADRIRQENAAKKTESEASNEREQTKEFMKQSCRGDDMEKSIAALRRFISEKLSTKEAKFAAQMELLRLCETAYIRPVGKGVGGVASVPGQEDAVRAARLYQLAQDIYEQHQDFLWEEEKEDKKKDKKEKDDKKKDKDDKKDKKGKDKKEDKEKESGGARKATSELREICDILCRMGYPQVADRFRPDKEHRSKVKEGRECLHTPVRLQMMYGGHLMTRNVEPCPDDRVLFTPDRWQRDLLDIVDAGESALVVAPTSAGKTFAAYYAMEKVLRADDDGICVFVSPTKALVNQVAAEVYARFRGKTYTEGGKSVFGMKLRDYGYYDFDCQVLVTVPAVLEGLLLSPHETIQAWVRRIKFVIFDEVHCIGQSATANREAGTAESGSVWEHLLVLVRCPFLALSATISNPGDLQRWMADTQAKSQRNVKLVQFNIRYSDLRKYVYLPPAHNPELKLAWQNQKPGEMRVLHPCAAMSVARLLRAGGFPQDLSFAPDESTALYDALVRAAKTPGLLEAKAAEAEGAALAALDPDAYFAQDRVITKARAKSFETDLKALVSRWLAAGEGHRRALQVALDAIVGDADRAFEVLDQRAVAEGAAGTVPWLAAHYLGLLRTLRENDKLPVITFCFDRKICEVLALETGALLEAEEEWRRTNTEEGRRKVRDREAKKAAREAARKAMEKASQKMKGREMEEMAQEGALESLAEEVEEDPCDEDLTFVKKNEGMTDSEYADFMEEVKWKLARDPRYGPLVRLLRRGIGVHHAGLNKKYREAVEILFRRKHIKVVLATGTLALGINMPCRTVVFAGDSVFLNALQYRQMSGRAGRRGFDDIGHVVFFGLPRPKLNRLLIADMPRLRGHYPLSTSLVLRSLCLYTQSCMQPVGRPPLPAKEADERRERTGEKVLSLLGQPLFCHGGDSLGAQVYHRVRYALEYLRRSRYIDRDASLDGLSGLAVHLFNSDPACFALCRLVGSGALHGVVEEGLRAPGAAQGRPNVAEAARRLVLVLSHLFGVIRTPRSVLAAYRPKSASIGTLPALPEEVEAVLDRHNAAALRLAARSLRAFLRAGGCKRAFEEAPKLPLSGVTSPAWTASAATAPPAPAPALLAGDDAAAAIPFLARSPFSAIAGKGDRFDTVEDLVGSVREGVRVEPASVPVVPSTVRASRKRTGTLQNAYLYDFMGHGQGGDLEAGNRLEAGDVWFVLNDFKLVLKTLSASLAKLLAEEEEDALAEVVAAALADFHDKLKTLELDRRY